MATSQLPWQSIPRFIPGTTNVQEYSQKLRFLAEMWPKESLHLLAPRAALLVEGTAFKLVALLDPEKLKAQDTTGVQLLVTTIGGKWGATDFEEKFEFFERSLYGTIQKSDESHDSFLSRFEANFTELLQRKTTLEEVQAYVLLRQSSLPPEDKKKILLEHGGKLQYQPVVSSFRLLGSKFFHEVQAGKPTVKNKVYDVNMVEESEMNSTSAESSERVIFLSQEETEPELDSEYMEAMIAAENQDAMTVSAFESELEEFLQDTPEMHDAFVTYQEARQRLLDQKRSRGFWPPRGGGKKGGYKGRGKGSGKGARREQLLARIAKSHCRHCGEKGHWRAECPSRNRDNPSQSAAATANVVQQEDEALLPSIDENDEIFTNEELDLAEACERPAKCLSFSTDFLRSHKKISSVDHSVFSHDVEHAFMAKTQDMTGKYFPSFNHAANRQMLAQRMSLWQRSHECPGSNPVTTPIHKSGTHNPAQDKTQTRIHNSAHVHASHPVAARHARGHMSLTENPKVSQVPDAFVVSCPDRCEATSAILDTGASRSVIGSKVLETLLQKLPQEVQNAVRKKPSNVKFRFGNNQTLTSKYCVYLPLYSVDVSECL